MRKTLLPILAIAAIGLAGAAMAKTETTLGTVKTFNARAHALTLADGTAFHLQKVYKKHAFKVGEPVLVKWEMKGKEHLALHVFAHRAKAPAKPAKAKH